MSNYLIRLLFISLILKITQSQFAIHTKIKSYSLSLDCIYVKLNNFNFTTIISLDLNSTFTWIYNRIVDKYNINGSIIIKDHIKLSYGGFTLLGNEEKTKFSLPESEDKSITLQLYTISTSVPGMHGSYALGHTFTDVKYSIVHQYYLMGYINSLSFSIINEKNNQSLYLGGIPDNYTEGRYQSSCDALRNQTNWSCYLSQIAIQTSEKQFISNVNSIFYFNNVDWFSYCPSYFMDDLIENFFKKEMQANDCFFLEKRPKRVIVCVSTDINKKGNITFTIGDYVYTLRLEEYWMCGEELCRFGIIESPNDNQFAFGTLFYQKFNILFDYQKSKISFYSFQSIEKVLFNENINRNKTLIKSIWIGIVIFLLIGIAIVVSKIIF